MDRIDIILFKTHIARVKALEKVLKTHQPLLYEDYLNEVRPGIQTIMNEAVDALSQHLESDPMKELLDLRESAFRFYGIPLADDSQ